MSSEDTWRCPKCNAPANGHGKGPCVAPHCTGLICECEVEDLEASEGRDHGTVADRCPFANCYHCGWSGAFPPLPKGLQAWEKKALLAGWTPPAARQVELDASTKKKVAK